MTRLCGTISLWIAGLVFLFVGVNTNEPYLISLRGSGADALFVASNVVFVFLIRRGYWNGRGAAGKLLVLLWGLPSLAMLNAHISFEGSEQDSLHTQVSQPQTPCPHFVLRYSSFYEVAPLPE